MVKSRAFLRNPLSVWFWIAAALLTVAIWSAILLTLAASERRALADAADVRRNLARSLAEHQESSVRAIDLSLVHLRDVWLRDRAAFAYAVERQETLLRNEGGIQVAVLDREGWVKFSRLPVTGPPVNFSDREYFQIQKVSGRDELHISKPVLGRVTGRWSLQLTRPIYDKDDAFDGLIVVAVPVPALELVYNEVNLGRDGVVSLVRSDGEVLARTGARDPRALTVDSPPVAPEGARVGEYETVGSDGVHRGFSFRKLKDYPLAVHVGQSTATVLAPLGATRNIIVGGALLATILLWGASAFAMLWRRQRAQTVQMEAELENVTRESERQFFEERERTMLELHDGCIQSLYAIGLQLEHSRQLIGHQATDAADAIAEAAARLNLTIQELRQFIAGEKPRRPSPAELVAEIRAMLPQGDPDALRATIEVDNAAAERLTAEQSAHVLRLLRESLSNVERHAGAQSVNVTLQLIGDRLCLEVKDDGVGIPAHGALGTGLGLHHIRVRAQRLGGKARIHSSPGEGTWITVDFPAAA